MVVSPMLGLGCGSTNPQQESLSEFYWEVQGLRQKAGNTSTGTEALRDLGVIYLRTGYYQDAYNVLSRSLVQDRSDPKRWFYSGLSLELLERPEAALSTYARFLSLSSASLHTRAMRGRVSWLRSVVDRKQFEDLFARVSLPPTDGLSPDLYAVFPFECVSDSEVFNNVGLGLSEIISGDFEQLRNVEMIDPRSVRLAYQIAGTVQNSSGLSRPAWTGRMLGAGKIIGGTCNISGSERLDIDLIVQDLITDDVIHVSGSELLASADALQKQLVQDAAQQLRIWIPDREGANLNSFPGTEALIAFSDGIASEDAGEIDRSLSSFRTTLELKPSFSLADLHRQRIENMVLARASSKKDLIDLLVHLESSTSQDYLLESTLQQLGLNLGMGFVPGQDSRKQPPSNVGELPPPPTPTRN